MESKQAEQPLIIPPADSDWGTLAVFALTFNAYHYIGNPTELSIYFDKLPDDGVSWSMDDLRARLFWVQRAARWNQTEDSNSDLEEMRGIIGAMHAKQITDS